MLITITDVVSPQPIPMGNIQAPGYCIRFEAKLVAGHAIFVPADTPPEQLPGQQFVVEANYESIEDYHRWTGDNRPTPTIEPLAQLGDYQLVATVHIVTPLTDDKNRVAVDVVIGDIAFGFTANEIGSDMPRVGDVVSCIVRTLSLWDEAI